MYCRNCGYVHHEDDRFCRYCGAQLNTPAAPKKGSLWAPVLIMAILCSIGIGLFFALPSAGGTDAAPAENGWFRVDNGVLHFDEARYAGGSELTVPGKVSGQTVTALAEGCFENCAFLTSVELPDTLEVIGRDAFRGCTGLRGIQIPESVKRIESEAFYGCAALEAVALSDTLEAIGADAFDECNKLHYVIFDGSHQDWIELYDEFITPYTGVFCEEGSFYQGKPKEDG